MSEMENKTMPVHKSKVGNIDEAVWEQTGENGKFLTITAHRSYLKKGGDVKNRDDWEKTNTLRVNDIPSMILGLQKAFEFAKLKSDVQEE